MHHQHLNFISERLVHSLSLPRTNQSICVSGIGGIYHNPPIQSVTRFQLSSLQPSGRKIDVTVVVVPKVTCDLPLKPVTFEIGWMHLSDLPLDDLDLVNPVKLKYCLVLTFLLRYYVRAGGVVLLAPPTAFETDPGWVLCGSAGFTLTSTQANVHSKTFHTSATSSDDVLRNSGRLKNRLLTKLPYLLRNVQLFVTSSLNHSCCKEGRLIVPLPKDPNARPIGESRSQAVKRFLSLEPKGFSS